MIWRLFCLALMILGACTGSRRLTRIVQLRTRSRRAMEFASTAAADPAVPSEPSAIVSNTAVVKSRMVEAATRSGRDGTSIRLVAVSKTKPASDILELYTSGHRAFGENYFQELLEKAAALPEDIQWHFIGHLQSQKASKLVRDVKGLYVVETVDSLKLAKKLNSACESAERASLDVYLQVDTSGEDTKSGVPPSETVGLAQSIAQECPRLRVAGLMTIGAPGDLSAFDRLAELRVDLARALQVAPDSLALSMGMSGDFPEAVARGATSIRVGSTIFGARIYAETR